jgi:hypothetical protein
MYCPRIYHALPVSLTNTTPLFRPIIYYFITHSVRDSPEGTFDAGHKWKRWLFAYLPGLLHLVPSNSIDNLVPIECCLHLCTQCQITYPQEQSSYRGRPASQYITTCSSRTPFTHPLLDIRLLLMSRLGIPLSRADSLLAARYPLLS